MSLSRCISRIIGVSRKENHWKGLYSACIQKNVQFCGLQSSNVLNDRLLSSTFNVIPPSITRLPVLPRRSLSGDVKENAKKDKDDESNNPDAKEDESDDQNLSLYQRFKATYKTHGKILIAVHISTYFFWFGGFYYAIHTGVDIVAALKYIRIPDYVITAVQNTHAGDLAFAYLLCKIASPLRYMVTLGGTRLAVTHLRNIGRIPEIRDEDRLRNLAKESRESIREIAKDQREILKERYEDRKEALIEKYEDRKDTVKEKLESQRDRFKKGREDNKKD